MCGGSGEVTVPLWCFRFSAMACRVSLVLPPRHRLAVSHQTLHACCLKKTTPGNSVRRTLRPYAPELPSGAIPPLEGSGLPGRVEGSPAGGHADKRVDDQVPAIGDGDGGVLPPAATLPWSAGQSPRAGSPGVQVNHVVKCRGPPAGPASPGPSADVLPLIGWNGMVDRGVAIAAVLGRGSSG